MINLYPTVGTVLNIAPTTGWHATIKTSDPTDPGDDTWTLPVVGWATVVRYVDPEQYEYETQLEAVVLIDDEHPVPLSEHMREIREGANRDVPDGQTEGRVYFSARLHQGGTV